VLSSRHIRYQGSGNPHDAKQSLSKSREGPGPCDEPSLNEALHARIAARCILWLLALSPSVPIARDLPGRQTPESEASKDHRRPSQGYRLHAGQKCTATPSRIAKPTRRKSPSPHTKGCSLHATRKNCRTRQFRRRTMRCVRRTHCSGSRANRSGSHPTRAESGANGCNSRATPCNSHLNACTCHSKRIKSPSNALRLSLDAS
jgi:hypothetical protein